MEINERLFYLRADLGRRRLAVCKFWREAWRHMEFEWYDRAKRDEDIRKRVKQRLAELENTGPEKAAFQADSVTDQAA